MRRDFFQSVEKTRDAMTSKTTYDGWWDVT
jgi:hypothetical protein